MTDINREIGKLDWKREPYGLYEPIAYTLAGGGKRLRPTLAVLGAEVFGGDAEQVMPAALALEVFHNFTLLHDDVMDKAEVRRGRPTVHARWNENTAILSGDQMMIEAYRLLAQLPDDKLPTVLRMFNTMATGICEGQQYDMEFETRDNVTIDEYLNMIRLKTAVLLANALQTGAYLAGADREGQRALYCFGENLGLAFQLQDDYLDCYGDPVTFGKAIGGDIREGKKTFMLLTAINMANEEQKKELCSRDFGRVMAVYEQLHTADLAQHRISELTNVALSYLEKVPQNDATACLRQTAEKLINRKS